MAPKIAEKTEVLGAKITDIFINKKLTVENSVNGFQSQSLIKVVSTLSLSLHVF